MNQGSDGRQPGDAEITRPANQRDRQKAETRRRLLDAATDVFIEGSPITASLEEIAARTGVRRQTLLYHFGDRAGLMNEVLMYHMENFQSQICQFPGDLRSWLTAYLQAHRRPLVRMLLHLDELIPETPGSPQGQAAGKTGYWYPVVVADLEQRLLDAGVGPHAAYKRASLLAHALLHTAAQVARDIATDDEISDFVDTACELMQAPHVDTPPSRTGHGAPPRSAPGGHRSP